MKDLIRTTQLDKLPVPLYNCPSRRATTFHNSTGRALVDYAASVAGPARSEIGDAAFNAYLTDVVPTSATFKSKQAEIFWGCPGCPPGGGRGLCDLDAKVKAGQMPKFRGVIQRTDWVVDFDGCTPPWRHAGFTTKMTEAKINDGTSKTMLAAEKFVHHTLVLGATGVTSDDRGWTDGWDYDALRSTLIQPRSDGEGPAPVGTDPDDPGHYPFGSAHSGGMNAVFADGSVTFINFDIDLETFNRIGNRYDGEVYSQN